MDDQDKKGSEGATSGAANKNTGDNNNANSNNQYRLDEYAAIPTAEEKKLSNREGEEKKEAPLIAHEKTSHIKIQKSNMPQRNSGQGAHTALISTS